MGGYVQRPPPLTILPAPPAPLSSLPANPWPPFSPPVAPRHPLPPLLPVLRAVQESVPELLAAQQTITNAYGLYLRTRPTASPQSVKRAKELPFGGLHPTLLAALPKTKYTNAHVGHTLGGGGGWQ